MEPGKELRIDPKILRRLGGARVPSEHWSIGFELRKYIYSNYLILEKRCPFLGS